MKNLRIINAALFSVLAVILDIMVVVNWHKNSLSVQCMVLGLLVYTVCCVFFALFVDEHIKESNKK